MVFKCVHQRAMISHNLPSRLDIRGSNVLERGYVNHQEDISVSCSRFPIRMHGFESIQRLIVSLFRRLTQRSIHHNLPVLIETIGDGSGVGIV